MGDRPTERMVAERLAELYDWQFGGKERGRFRISTKHMQALTGRRRLPDRTVQRISEELFELGFVLIDLDTFYVVLAQRTFRNYRRVSDASLVPVTGAAGHA